MANKTFRKGRTRSLAKREREFKDDPIPFPLISVDCPLGWSHHSEPEVYFSNNRDPAYGIYELAYIQKHVFRSRSQFQKWLESEAIRANYSPTAIDHPDYQNYVSSLADYYIGRIGYDMVQVPDKGIISSEHAEKATIEAIKRFGDHALRLEGSRERDVILTEFRENLNEKLYAKAAKDEIDRWLGPSRESPELKKAIRKLHHLGSRVSDMIRHWRAKAQHGDLEERRNASKRLKEIGKVLTPDLRGTLKKGRKHDPLQVKVTYFRNLFKFYQIENALASAGGPRNHARKLNEVSENFDIETALLWEFLGLDENCKPLRGSGSFTLKDMARELTARHFQITHQTILNILAT